MRTRLFVLLVLVPLLGAWDPLQRANRAVEEGNGRLQSGKPEDALSAYDRAVKELPADPAVRFNRGTALFALSRYDEAVGEFLRATEAKSPALKGAAFYNLGNAFFKLEKYADAIAAYRRALALDPTDIRAKWNLELALKKKVEQDRQKQRDQQDQQDQQDKKDDQKNDGGKDKDKSDKPDPGGQGDPGQGKPEDGPDPSQGAGQEQQHDKDKGQDQQKPGEQQPAPKPADDRSGEQKDQGTSAPAREGQDPAATPREIEAVLDSLERSPKDLEKLRARMRAVRRAPPAKDW